MEIQGRKPDNSITTPSLDDNSNFVVTQSQSKYQKLALDGKLWIGANLGGTPVTTQAGLSATTPALILYNPVGSGYNLVLHEVTIDITTSPAAAAGLMLAYNAAGGDPPTLTTVATVTNAKLGATGSPVGQCYRVSTLAGAPIACRFIGGTTGAAAIGGVQLIDKVDGAIVIPQGATLSVQSTTAAAILTSFTWSEVAV